MIQDNLTEIRFACSEEEQKSCLLVRQKVFVEEQHVDPNEEFDELDRFIDNTHVLLCYQGNVVGTARLKPLTEQTVRYQRIAILKEYRGKKLGAVLLSGLDRLAKRLGYTHVVIDAQKYAEGFYEKCSFITSDPTIFLDAGIEHIRMEKDI